MSGLDLVLLHLLVIPPILFGLMLIGYEYRKNLLWASALGLLGVFSYHLYEWSPAVLSIFIITSLSLATARAVSRR